MSFETICSDYYQSGLSKMYRPNPSILTVSGREGELGVFESPDLGQTSGTSDLADDVAQKWRLSFQPHSYEELFSLRLKKASSIQIKVTPKPAAGLYKRNAQGELLRIENQIKAALESAPLEDGYSHSAEILLERAIRDSSDLAGEWLIGALSSQNQNDVSKAELLRLLSRMKPFTSKWRMDVITLGLSSSNVEFRDAAVQAVECWEEVGAIQLLQTHNEPCAWLADYISRVIRDLTKQ